jgi:putative ABC transport system permease protein
VGGFRFHLHLALVSLRRDRRLTSAVVVCLALGSGVWTMVLTHYLRTYPPAPALSPGLHQVEIRHPQALVVDDGPATERGGWHARTRVTYPEYELLARSGVATRETGTYRARLMLAPDVAAPAEIINCRFVSADFFGLFAVATGDGRTFMRDEETAGEAVAVVGRRYAEAHFGSAAVGNRTLLVEGRPFRVVGVLAGDQPERPEWDVIWTARDQDAVYLPFDWGRRLGAWPERAVPQSPLPAADAIWGSDAVFVAFWLELPDAASRAAYERHLARRLGPRGQPYWLRSFAAWRPLFIEPARDIVVYMLLSGLGLAGSAFTVSRLLLAKGLARRSELAIYRALGATRSRLFWMQMLEAAILMIPATALGVAAAAAQHAFYNRFVLENDMPVVLDALSVAIGGAGTVLVGLLAAAYPAWRAARTPPTVYLGHF